MQRGISCGRSACLPSCVPAREGTAGGQKSHDSFFRRAFRRFFAFFFCLSDGTVSVRRLSATGRRTVRWKSSFQ